MDPLTHTLVGASLAGTRLGRTTRLAGPALVVGANLPDLDVLSYFAGSDAALGFRRGWTHGVPALIVLPALLAGLLWLWGRRSGSEGRPPPSGRWLAALSYLAVLTHPALDWLNTYGMRWWMPFSDSWSYGDALFIMDPWLWLILGVAWLLPRRPTKALWITLGAVVALLLWIVSARAALYLPVVVLVALALAAAIAVHGSRIRALPALGLILGGLYIACMIGLQAATESRVRSELASRGTAFSRLMVGPVPVNPLRWDVLFEDTDGHYRYGSFRWGRHTLRLVDRRLRAAPDHWLETVAAHQIPGFLRWTRFPWSDRTRSPDGRIYVLDARYARGLPAGFGSTSIEPPPGGTPH